MKNLITKEGFEKLEKHLKFLKNIKRREVARDIEKALALEGDTGDNPELDTARQEQAMVEKEITEVEEILDNSQIIRKRRSTRTARIGSTVKVKAENLEAKFKIVGATEADPHNGKISHASPLGQALLNRTPGEKILVELPDGKMQYLICTVS